MRRWLPENPRVRDYSMEHLLIQSIAGLIRWLNRRSLKPLSRVIPDLEALRADPKATLRAQPIEIGPRRRLGSLLVTTALLSGLILLFSCLGLGFAFDNAIAAQPPPAAVAASLLFLVAVPAAPLAIGFTLRRMIRARAGEAVLHSGGVLFSTRHETVFCPWDLFNAAGEVARSGEEQVVVPVAPAAVPLIIVEKDEERDDQQPIQSQPLSDVSDNEVVLRGLYEVDVYELARLLLEIGRRLGQPERGQVLAAAAPTDQVR
jgi:hypothetical protein